MEVTNNSQAPQGVHTLGGVAYVMPKETKTLDLTVDQAKQASKLGFFDLVGDPVKDETATATLSTIDIPDNEIDQLRQQLESSTADVSQLNSSLDDALDEIERQKGLVADRDKEIAGLKALVAEHEAEIEQLKASVAAFAQQPGTGQGQQMVTPVGPFEVRDTSAGWFGIFGADGNQVGKSIRAADADAFKALDAEAQLAYLTAPSAPASA
jgi:hypothetical protein